ncbi:MAG TPA: ATP-dependent helicase, partial [Acidobacteriota bacterium]|nr:ATP-dependent helicase [Acidobacteriota bacterium]
MSSHGPKRVYTPQSLEFWFEKLAVEWEQFFGSEPVERGHQMYRDSEIREIELGAKDAIIHRKVDKKEEYAVIEWEGDELRVRSSTTDETLAHAIAVAGLHEIEELVADEMSGKLAVGSTPPMPMTKNGRASGDANGHGAKAEPSGNGKDRDLLLSFTATGEGLVFLAFWKQGKNRVPALGNTAIHPTATERAKLIALATYARKAHFRYNQVTHAYAMEALADIPGFLKDVLPHWKKQFGVEVDAKVDSLKLGARTIEIEAVAERKPARAGAGAGEGGGLNLRWIFRAGEKLLTDEQAAALLKHGRTPFLVPDLGIVTMAQEKWDSLNQWRKNLEETEAAGEVPPYLIFSLFNDSRISVTLGPELEVWRKKVLTPPVAPPALPDYLRNYQRRGVEWMHH